MKLGCHSDPLSLGNGLISTTGSKADVAGDECLHQCAATACAPTLPNNSSSSSSTCSSRGSSMIMVMMMLMMMTMVMMKLMTMVMRDGVCDN